MRASEQLKAAKQYIVEHGWQRRKLISWDGRVCMVGALVFADGTLNVKNVVQSPTYRYLQRITGHGWVPGWNDAEGRSVEEVYEAFDRAIALAEEDEYGTEPVGPTETETNHRLGGPSDKPTGGLLVEDCKASTDEKVLVGV